MKTFVKDPESVLDYEEDWTDCLADGETIYTSSWTASSGITVDSDQNDTNSATVWLSGGTDGEDYVVTNQIVTTEARIFERSIIIRCRHR